MRSFFRSFSTFCSSFVTFFFVPIFANRDGKRRSQGAGQIPSHCEHFSNYEEKPPWKCKNCQGFVYAGFVMGTILGISQERNLTWTCPSHSGCQGNSSGMCERVYLFHYEVPILTISFSSNFDHPSRIFPPSEASDKCQQEKRKVGQPSSAHDTVLFSTYLLL